MLYTYTNTDQTLAVNGVLSFANNTVNSCSCISHTAGTTTINLNKPGIYMINFNADIANNTSVSGETTIQMYSNGSIYTGAEATATSASLTDVQNLSFSALVKVLPNCCAVQTNTPTSITFLNTGVSAIVANAAVTVVKLK